MRQNTTLEHGNVKPFKGIRWWLKVRNLFVAGNDAYVFFDANFEFNYHALNVDDVDFHKAVSVFHRLMGW